MFVRALPLGSVRAVDIWYVVGLADNVGPGGTEMSSGKEIGFFQKKASRFSDVNPVIAACLEMFTTISRSLQKHGSFSYAWLQT